jgi:hypothetical protein
MCGRIKGNAASRVLFFPADRSRAECLLSGASARQLFSTREAMMNAEKVAVLSVQ